jgi:hypothetical protein
MIVAYICNPSFSGGKDQKDDGFEDSLGQIVPEILSQKKSTTKKGLMEWLKV